MSGVQQQVQPKLPQPGAVCGGQVGKQVTFGNMVGREQARPHLQRIAFKPKLGKGVADQTYALVHLGTPDAPGFQITPRPLADSEVITAEISAIDDFGNDPQLLRWRGAGVPPQRIHRRMIEVDPVLQQCGVQGGSIFEVIVEPALGNAEGRSEPLHPDSVDTSGTQQVERSIKPVLLAHTFFSFRPDLFDLGHTKEVPHSEH